MCSEKGCDRPVLARGLCRAHYSRQLRGLDLAAPIRRRRPKSTGLVVEGTEQKDNPRMINLEARSLKATIVLDAAAVAGLEVPNGAPRIKLRIAVGGRSVSADLSSKGLRRAVTTIRQAGADAVAVVLQGKLEGDNLVDAGIIAQPRAAKAAPEEAASSAAG